MNPNPAKAKPASAVPTDGALTAYWFLLPGPEDAERETEAAPSPGPRLAVLRPSRRRDAVAVPRRLGVDSPAAAAELIIGQTSAEKRWRRAASLHANRRLGLVGDPAAP